MEGTISSDLENVQGNLGSDDSFRSIHSGPVIISIWVARQKEIIESLYFDRRWGSETAISVRMNGIVDTFS